MVATLATLRSKQSFLSNTYTAMREDSEADQCVQHSHKETEQLKNECN